MGALRFLASGLAVCLALGCGAVEAEELVLPYSCTMDGGTPRLTPSEETTYRIIGPRQDLAFPSCSGSAAWTCETMMIYKFAIECGGQRVAWAKVAAAARETGVRLPDQLPAGYAPVSKLRGRFVFPGFGRTTTMPQVASQSLSADAVIEPAALRSEGEGGAEPAPWITVVDPATALAAGPGSGNAWKVAGVLSMLLISMMAACLLLVRRRELTSFAFSHATAREDARTGRLWDFVTGSLSRGAAAFGRSYESWKAASASDEAEEEEDGSNPIGHVHARLHEIEHLVASLPGDLLLRDVLASELDSLYDRTADLGRRAAQIGPEKLRSAVRAITRDLDRIARIAQGAMPAWEERASTAEADPPSTIFEAYRILGLNPDAPDAAVKKIVDALRMSWHPDHARDEADRLHREQRIKQINAAWDLLKVRRAAAA